MKFSYMAYLDHIIGVVKTHAMHFIWTPVHEKSNMRSDPVLSFFSLS